jgi:uncharacterized protein (DUF58 family)
VRPRVRRSTAVLASLGGAFFVIARTTGSGWLMVLLSGIVALLSVAASLSFVDGRTTRVQISAPRDATVGRPLRMAVSGRARGALVRLVAPESDWFSIEGEVRGEVSAVPARRGVVREVTAEIVTGWPVGLFVWRRRQTSTLARPIEVGPAPIPVEVPSLTSGDTGDGRAHQARADGDLPRGVREYVPGDPVRLVHWPATARARALMVKELDAPGSPALIVSVNLSGPSADAVEAAAGRAAGLAHAALAAGVPVTLLTAEAHGPVAGPVRSQVEVGRRLARATAGTPAVAPPTASATVVRVTASTVEEPASPFSARA